MTTRIIAISLLFCAACHRLPPDTAEDGLAGDKGEKGDPGEDGVDGRDGRDGAQGPAGPAGRDGDGWRPAKSDVYMMSASVDVFANQEGTVTAACGDVDDLVLSGGCYSPSDDHQVFILNSYPFDATASDVTSAWTCTMANRRSATIAITAYALCLRGS